MQMLRISIVLVVLLAIASQFVMAWRKEARRRAYLRKREARTRQQWAV